MQITSNDLGSVEPGDTAHLLIKTTDVVEHVRIMVRFSTMQIRISSSVKKY